MQFSAKVEIKPDYRNVKAGKAIGKTSGVQEANTILESIKTTMTIICRDLQERETNVTPERIKNVFFGIEVRLQMLLVLFKRQKTDVQSSIPLLDVAKQILKKYKGTLPDEKAVFNN